MTSIIIEACYPVFRVENVSPSCSNSSVELNYSIVRELTKVITMVVSPVAWNVGDVVSTEPSSGTPMSSCASQRYRRQIRGEPSWRHIAPREATITRQTALWATSAYS